MNQSIFQRESAKYDALWQDGYRDANWPVLASAVNRNVSTKGHSPSLIDFGFGRGNALAFFQNLGYDVTGVEISSFVVDSQRQSGRRVYHASLDDLGILKDNQFEIGFCNDVLEHMPEEYVRKSLQEMARVCSAYLFISVCPKPAHRTSQDGENLHLTVKPKRWWKKLMCELGDVTTLWPYLSRSGRYKVELPAP
jgi:SAM-dependent methyltransferase